jgi:hypothetical protein
MAYGHGVLIPDGSILLWAVEMTWRLNTQLASRQKTLQHVGLEVSLVKRIHLLSQSDLQLHSGLSYWPCTCTIFARGASNRRNNTCRTLSLRQCPANTMYDSLRNHLTRWHFLKVALLPEHRNASYQ